MAVKLSGSLRERHCDGSFISVNFQILDFSIDSSWILGFTSTKLRLSLFCRNSKQKENVKSGMGNKIILYWDAHMAVCKWDYSGSRGNTYHSNHGCCRSSLIIYASSNCGISRRKIAYCRGLVQIIYSDSCMGCEIVRYFYFVIAYP